MLLAFVNNRVLEPSQSYVMNAQPPPSSRPSILVVDDDRDICQALSDLLEFEGYQVQTSNTGADALARVEQFHFDALILDIGLPDLDGFSVLKLLTEREPNLPVIILTAFTTEEKKIGSLRGGAFGYLTKPYNKEELKATLRRAVGYKTLATRAEQVERALGVSEERVQESERQYRILMEEASDAILIGDLEGHLIMANSKACEMLGYSREELQGLRVEDTYPPEQANLAQQRIEAARAGQTLRFERLLRRKDGSSVPVEVSLTRISDNRLLAIVRDITARKQAEEALHFQKALLESQREASLDGILLVSPEGTMISYNRRFVEMWGIPEDMLACASDEAARQAVRDKLVNPESFSARVQYLYQHPDETSFDEIRLKDGRIFDRYSAPIKSYDGLHYGRVWYFRDVTAERRAEEELKASEARYRLAVKAAHGVVRDWDILKGRVVWNDALQSIFGYGQQEPGSTIESSYQWWSDRIHPDDRERVTASVEAVSRPGGGDEWSAEYRFRKADGAYAIVLDRGYVARNEHGDAVRMIGSMTDITGFRATLDELQTLNRLGQTLSAELDLYRLVQLITDMARELSRAQFGAFFYNVVDDRGERYMLYTLSGASKEEFAKFPMPRNTELFDPTFRGRAPVRLDNVRRDSRYGKNAPYYGTPPGHLPVTSYLAVPVVSRAGEVLGGLFFGHPDAGVFTEREERLVVNLAAHAAIAIDNARLYEAAQRARAQAEESERRFRSLNERLEKSKAELQEKIADLETFEQAVVGRELKMIELEKELARLRQENEALRQQLNETTRHKRYGGNLD